ncbi:MAG: hypothetical protein D6806_00090 [Deltaproteobacteria bacterium]|nr:MAG: hypothetical protein D6806_00090 [Deltaproteobacteria bacterium]
MRKRAAAVFAAVVFFGAQQLMADTLIFVGGNKAAGKAAAEKAGGKWVKSLTKAFKKAAKVKQGRIELRLAEGKYKGDLGSGAYKLPKFDALGATLVISGGWYQDFTKRDPFGHPSWIVTDQMRSAPLWTFERNSKLGGLIIDGLVWDSAASNKYDAKTNSLLIGKSCTHPFLKLNYLETDLLSFRNSVFMNSANRVVETLIRAHTPKARIEFKNCIFFNNRIPLKLDSARFRNKPAEILVDHCSFLLNWPYNPDPGTGNRGAIELGPSDAAKVVRITNNLFWANIGGAIQAAFTKLPALYINNNDFIGNGLLHGKTEPGAVAMIVTAGGRMQDIDLGTIEDVDAVEEAEGNVSIDPALGISIGNPKMVDASKVKVEKSWENSVRSILGMNLQGGRVAIKDYAPRKEYSPANPPFPKNPKAAKYGASPKLVE